MKVMKMELTREQWLQHAVSFVRRTMVPRDVTVPPVKVSCSWPGGGDSQKRIGECWPRKASKAKINELFISPKLEDPAKVISVLVHELAHAVDDCANGHKMPFVAIGMKMGLEGKPTQMSLPDATAAAWAGKLVAKHGAFPHRTLDKSKSPIKPQTARMLKVECGDCGAVWRMSQKHVDNVTCCPCCQGENVTVEVKGETETND
jgi:hypothetical protein